MRSFPNKFNFDSKDQSYRLNDFVYRKNLLIPFIFGLKIMVSSCREPLHNQLSPDINPSKFARFHLNLKTFK
jgi:hypothetical protein